MESQAGPTPKPQRQLERVNRLPKAQQHLILAMLDGVLLEHGQAETRPLFWSEFTFSN